MLLRANRYVGYPGSPSHLVKHDDAAGDTTAFELHVALFDLIEPDMCGDQFIELETTLQVELRVYRNGLLRIRLTHVHALDTALQ